MLFELITNNNCVSLKIQPIASYPSIRNYSTRHKFWAHWNLSARSGGRWFHARTRPHTRPCWYIFQDVNNLGEVLPFAPRVGHVALHVIPAQIYLGGRRGRFRSFRRAELTSPADRMKGSTCCCCFQGCWMVWGAASASSSRCTSCRNCRREDKWNIWRFVTADLKLGVIWAGGERTEEIPCTCVCVCVCVWTHRE